MSRVKVTLLISIGFLIGLLLGAYLLSQRQTALRRIHVPTSRNVVFYRVSARLAEGASNKDPAAASRRAASSAPPVTATDYQRLAIRGLEIPVRGVQAKSIQDTFNESRGGHPHQATDIIAPRGAAVVAVEDGSIKKLFTSRWGGLTIYQFDPSGNYCYYYAHLDRYREGIKEGLAVRRGDTIAYVGSTGDADTATPHLHFAIFKLGPEKNWWQGTAINPYPILMASLNPK
jgi:murein DD-endopeptidase MepM/ murein hydrolase activator NlpD